MMIRTDTPTSPWFVVESDVKKHARLNMIAHLLSSIPYTEVPAPEVELPARLTATSDYQRPPREHFTYVPDYAAKFLGDLEA
jgi:polyphosphate kinase